MPLSVRLLAVGLVAVLATATVACTPGSPVDRLEGHLQSLIDIVNDNSGTPKAGVEALRAYTQDNLGDILHALGQVVVDIDKLDGEARDTLVKDFNDRVLNKIIGLGMVSAQFSNSVKDDPAAQEYLNEWMESWKGMQELASNMPGMPGLSGSDN